MAHCSPNRLVRTFTGSGVAPQLSSASAVASEASLNAPKISAGEGRGVPVFAAERIAVSIRLSSATWRLRSVGRFANCVIVAHHLSPSIALAVSVRSRRISCFTRPGLNLTGSDWKIRIAMRWISSGSMSFTFASRSTISASRVRAAEGSVSLAGRRQWSTFDRTQSPS